MSNNSTHISDRVDRLLLRRRTGIPIFLVVMYLMFWVTFTVGEPFVALLETVFSWLQEFVSAQWSEDSWPLLRSLVTEGMIAGIGGVLVFVPNIFLLFVCIELLEKSGAMGRAARVMDSAMDKMGLHGKSFVPLLMGFGCSVPALQATSMIDNKRDRLATIFVIPLMSCSARFPIYTLFIPAMFASRWQAPVLWLIYLFGIVLALLIAKVLSKTLLQHVDDEELPIELIPWNIPTVMELFRQAGLQAWLYVRKVGTVILGFSIILWALSVFPVPPTELPPSERIAYSYAGRLGHALEPVLKPMGMDWKAGTALIGAVAAKEVFVVQLGIVNAIGNSGEESGQHALRKHLKNDYTPLSALSIMLFCLIGLPCISSVVAAARAAESWKWGLFQFGGLTAIAWVVVTMIFQTVSRIAMLISG